MSTARYAHTATLLNNGTVLVAGGYVGGGSATAELYNPATAAFTFIGSTSVPRAGHIAKLLNNGLILVEGGYNSSGGFLATAEIFTPTSLTPPGLVSISVSPQNASILLGATQQFIAIGAFGDNSTQTLASATWSSSDGTVAAISNDGGNHGLTAPAGAGTTTITASAGPIGGSAMLRVTAPSTLVSIAVTPSNPSIAAGLTQQFTATGTYVDGSTHDLTSSASWSSSNTIVATIRGAGLAASWTPGATAIQAASVSVLGSTLLTVTPAVLLSIAVTPASASISLGRTQQFTA